MSQTTMVSAPERSERNLTAEQWQGLAQLADLVTTAKKILEGPAGAVATGYLAQSATLMPDGALPAVREALELLTSLHEQGIIAQLGTVISLGAQTLTRDNLNQFFTSALDMAQETSFAEVLRASFQDAARESVRESEHLGGFTGLLRVMKDKEVQTGLRMMGVMAGKLSPLLHPHPAPASDR